MQNPFRYFNSSPEIIRLTVMMYIRYPLSLRQVEDLLFERGIDPHESAAGPARSPAEIWPDRQTVCAFAAETDELVREAIFSALAGGLLAVDHERRVLFINAQGRVMLEVPEGSDSRLKGTPLRELTRNSGLIDVVETCLERRQRTDG